MLVNVAPVTIILLAGFVLGEVFGQNLLVGCALAFGGVLVIGLADADRGGSALRRSSASGPRPATPAGS